MEGFIKDLNFSYGKYREYEIFTDVIKLTAFFIQWNMLFNNSYENKYYEVLKKYTEEEQQIMKELVIKLCLLFEEHQEELIDILGKIFHLINANNKELGQFFTPIHLQELCSEIVGLDYEEMKTKGYVTLSEPSSGSGGMIVAYAKKLKKDGYDYRKQMVVEARDLDILCSYMCYVQLSLYDIPAKIINGDTLSGDSNFIMCTPQYILGNWESKIREQYGSN